MSSSSNLKKRTNGSAAQPQDGVVPKMVSLEFLVSASNGCPPPFFTLCLGNDVGVGGCESPGCRGSRSTDPRWCTVHNTAFSQGVEEANALKQL